MQIRRLLAAERCSLALQKGSCHPHIFVQSHTGNIKCLQLRYQPAQIKLTLRIERVIAGVRSNLNALLA